MCLFVTSRQKKVHCFSDHLTCPIKNIKKGGIEGQGLESKQAGRKEKSTKAERGKGRDEKHFEAERKFRVGVIDVLGGCVLGEGVGGLILRAGSKAK